MVSTKRPCGAPLMLAASMLLALPGCGGGAAPAASTVKVTKYAATPNATGLEFGFFEAENQQDLTLPLAGKRPLARTGYEHWAADETTRGQYTFLSVPNAAATHAYGEQVVTSVAISYSLALNGIASTIPAFYPQDITDPTTRTAAKAYLYAYTQYLLNQLGSVTLTIDNEMVSNWRLDATDADAPQRAQAWSAWYVEAVAVARQAAADLGMSANLRLQPIVNGDPFTAGNPIAAGAASNAWLVDAVAVSDGLAIDSYHSDPLKPVTDPQITIDTIQFWIDKYAAGKPVMMTENGFDTITQQDPSVTRDQRQGKLTGTEAEQATYYAGLMPALLQANAPGGIFHNQLRAFSLWSNVDNQHADSNDDIYFGLVREDNSYKPAAAPVQAGIRAFESDTAQAPWTRDAGTDVTAANATGISLLYTDGNQFEYLHYVDTRLTPGPNCRVRGTLAADGALVLHLNDTWKQVQVQAGAFEVQFSGFQCFSDAGNTLDVWATGAKFPFQQSVTNLALAMR